MLLHLPPHLLVEGGPVHVRLPRGRHQGRGRVRVVGIDVGGRVGSTARSVGICARSRIGLGGIRSAVGSRGAGRAAAPAAAIGGHGCACDCRRGGRSRSSSHRGPSAGGRPAAAGAAAAATVAPAISSIIFAISTIAGTSAAPVALVALGVGLVHGVREEGRLLHGIIGIAAIAIGIATIVVALALPLAQVVIDEVARGRAAGVGDAVAVEQAAASSALRLRSRSRSRSGPGRRAEGLLLEPSSWTHRG